MIEHIFINKVIYFLMEALILPFYGGIVFAFFAAISYGPVAKSKLEFTLIEFDDVNFSLAVSKNSATGEFTLRFKTYAEVLTVCSILGFLLLPMPSYAKDTGEFSVMVSFWTRHVDPSNDTNEKTGMVAITYNDYIVSRFINSYNNETFFAGKRFHTKEFALGNFKHLSVQGNLYTGLMHGYSDNLPNIGGISVGALPTVGLVWKKTSVEVGYVPTPSGGVFMSLIRFPFKLP